MIATVASATILGARGHPVTVEVHVAPSGIPGLTMLGLPDESCREARDRVRAAVTSAGLEWPNKKVVVNLSTHEAGGLTELDFQLATRMEQLLD